MKMNEICEGIETELDERGPASKKLCLSSVTDDKLGASQLSSCKSQGFRTRHSKRTYYLGKGQKLKVDGKKVKGKKYGGQIPY